MAKGIKGFSKQARERGAISREKHMIMRRRLAKTWNTKILDFMPKHIHNTIMRLNIPLDSVLTLLLPKEKKKKKDLEEKNVDGKLIEQRFSLDTIPERPEKQIKTAKGTPIAATREQYVVYALLDIIRKLM
jgi:hypothetical protein